MSKRCLGCMELFGDEFELCPHCGYIVNTGVEEAIHMEPGTLLYDRYIIGKVLGYGGFGVTYIAWDGKLEQKVAIKEYLPGEFSTRMPGQSQITVFNGEKGEQFRDGLHKFVEEAKHLAKFQNEQGIVKIFDSFEENDTAYIVMEYLDGETLTAYLRRVKTIEEDLAVAMLMPVMESLQVVHEAGLLHRDIAPDNIFLTKSGEVKLIDFGASRYATTSHSRSLTVIIKPGYSPEEQYRSRGDQGPHTDVYAIAATLYKMITGKTPPDAMERRAKYENQSKDILEEPHTIDKNISLNRENAILNAMNVRVEDRTPDIATFIKDLNADPPVKRVYGKIKKIDLYAWPLWLKILVPSVTAVLAVFTLLLVTGVIRFTNFTEEIVIPENIVTVPDVEGMYKDEALKLIADGKLLASTDGSVASEYIPAGKIILQTPSGGSYMNINSTVLLMLSSGKDTVVTPQNGKAVVPYVVWAEKASAIDRLKQAGLAEPEIVEKHDNSVAAGSVISQSVEAGTEVAVGTKITLTVSLGAASFEMPGVVGQTLEKANTALTSKGLLVAVQYKKDNAVPAGNVISQSVAKGASVKRGDKITLTVSSGSEIVTVTVPNVVGMTKANAEKALKDKKFKVTVLENYDATVAAGKVISQTPSANSSQLPNTNVTIYVSKGKQPITVTFNANGGSVKTASKTGYLSDTYGTLPTPTRTGYTFTGWYTSLTGGSKVTESTKINTAYNHTVFARWTANNYVVTFEPDGGTVSTESKQVTYNSAYGTLPTPTKTGCDFAGWYTLADDVAVNAASLVKTADDHSLRAKWTPKSYTLTFNYNGGSGTEQSRSVAYGSRISTLPTATRDHYTLDGWYTAKTGGTKIPVGTAMPAGNLTLYARWTSNPTSGWVPFSSVPDGADIVNERWTYIKTETTESTSSSLSGWTQTGSYWEKTSSGTHYYAYYPSGYNTSHSLYGKYSKSPLSASETATTMREVSSGTTYSYIYYHWSNVDCSSEHSSFNRPIMEYRNASNGYTYFYTFEDSTDYPFYGGSYGDVWKADRGQGSYWWFRFNVYKQTYQDYQKVYQYKKTTQETSYTKVTAGGNISNVEYQVRYIAK